MTELGRTSNPTQSARAGFAWFAAGAALAIIACFDAVMSMTSGWQSDEYSHAYLIPAISLFIGYKLAPSAFASAESSWLGLAFVAFAAVTAIVGELSTTFTLVQYAFILLLLGVFITLFGLKSSIALWFPFCFLVFMVPLPNFIFANLSQSLQLISSEIGVAVIRLLGISVYLEGNVIDLGSYQLQVVEACSGLRYLFPLMSFGALVAYLFKAPAWQRVVLFLSTIPITVVMNSIRIGLIGALVEHFGIGAAEGFLHYFEGWIIFVTCLAILLFEAWIFHKLSTTDGSVLDRLDLTLPDPKDVKAKLSGTRVAATPIVVAIIAIAALAILNSQTGSREEIVPAHRAFLQFPLLNEDWLGREAPMEQHFLDALKLTDYIIADYRHPEYALPVNLYIAYYGSQRKGASAHSPKSCLPGGGWVIKTFETIEAGFAGASSSIRPNTVNRVIIQKGNNRQLVYYWFEQRGRRLTNEYLVKWYLFWDSLTKNRTDGALVRLVLPVPDGINIEIADEQMDGFLRDFEPVLNRFIPN